MSGYSKARVTELARFFSEYARNEAGWDSCPATFRRTVLPPTSETLADAASILKEYADGLPEDGGTYESWWFNLTDDQRKDEIEKWSERHRAACHGGDDAQ